MSGAARFLRRNAGKHRCSYRLESFAAETGAAAKDQHYKRVSLEYERDPREGFVPRQAEAAKFLPQPAQIFA